MPANTTDMLEKAAKMSTTSTHQVIHEQAGVVEDIEREDDRAEQGVEVALLEAKDRHDHPPQHQHPDAREQCPPEEGEVDLGLEGEQRQS